MSKPKLIRITTVPISLEKLLENQLQFMSAHFEATAVSADKHRLKKFGEDQDVKTFHLNLTRKITPLKDLTAVWKLYTFLKKETPEIVHTHTPKAGIVGMLAAYLAKVPQRLHTVAGLPLMEATGLKRLILNTVEKLTYGCATKVYPNSKGLKEFITQHKFTKIEKLKIIGKGSSNGIDTAYFNTKRYTTKDKAALRQNLNIGRDDKVFIFVGRLVGDKGINELVTAFKGLSETVDSRQYAVRSEQVTKSPSHQVSASPRTPHPESRTTSPSPQVPKSQSHQVTQSQNTPQPVTRTKSPSHQITTSPCRLLLVGPLETELDPLQPETLNEIERNPNIISVGYQQDVRPYFAISDSLTFPSYREGFPNVVLQAGAMGLPSIVSDINGCNEIISHNQNGLIIPVKNTTALKDAMRLLLQDQVLYNQLHANARQTITNNYEQKYVWEELLKEYKSLEASL